MFDLDRVAADVRAKGVTDMTRTVVPDRWWPHCGDVLTVHSDPVIHVYADGHAAIGQTGRPAKRSALAVLDVLHRHLTAKAS